MRAGRKRPQSSPDPRAERAILGRGRDPRLLAPAAPSPARGQRGARGAAPSFPFLGEVSALSRQCHSAWNRAHAAGQGTVRGAGQSHSRSESGQKMPSVLGNAALGKVGALVCAGMQGCGTPRGKRVGVERESEFVSSVERRFSNPTLELQSHTPRLA